MATTGIVRRIDELGRIVVPREIRKHLLIREGEQMEISINDAGDIVLHKYYPLSSLDRIADQVVQALAQSTGGTAMICDRQAIRYAAGPHRRQWQDETVKKSWIDMMEHRRIGTLEGGMVLAPILVDGDVPGAVLFESNQPRVDDTAQRMCELAAGMLSRILEV